MLTHSRHKLLVLYSHELAFQAVAMSPTLAAPNPMPNRLDAVALEGHLAYSRWEHLSLGPKRGTPKCLTV
jgi:hypothetical protein